MSGLIGWYHVLLLYSGLLSTGPIFSKLGCWTFSIFAGVWKCRCSKVLNIQFSIFLFIYFNLFLSVLRDHSGFFFIPATTANDLRLRRIFYPRFYPFHLFSYLNSWETASIFPFECSVLNKDTIGTIFITSLVWRGPWLGIEPGTSGTRSQHYTTRLSRRRLQFSMCLNILPSKNSYYLLQSM